MSSDGSQLSPESVVDGYTIGAPQRSRVGAVTYAATDSSGAEVHLTVYDKACFPSALVRERTLRELRQLQGVSAPQVAKILAAGKIDESGVYEVTEPVPGEPIDVGSERSRSDVSGILSVIGEALLAAQKVGIIHRNLGANVVIRTPAGLKVTGFAVGEPHGGRSAGSIDTISPEQVQGKVVDQRSLIYNLAALYYQLRHGRPLFPGSVDDKLTAHVDTPPQVSDEILRRALAKEPRSRPMMLRQFLRELTELAGGVAAAQPAAGSSNQAPPAAAAPGSRPSTRGWTMFMEGDEQEADAPSGPSSDAPTSPEPAPAGPPTTRGWTMFMEAAESKSADSSGGAASPPPVAPPEPAAPSTRGWTMFMDEEGNEAPSSTQSPAEPAQELPPPEAPSPSPVETASAESPVVGATESPVPAPSTRGWTMFMEEDGTEASSQPDSSASVPAVEGAPSVPVPDASSQPPTSERAPSSAPAREVVPEPLSVDATVQMPPPSHARPAEASVETASSQSTDASAGTSGEAAGTPATRGWTMFMEAQLPGGADEPKKAAPASLEVVERTPAPVSSPASNEKAPSIASSPAEPVPVAGRTQMLSPAKAAQLRAAAAATRESRARTETETAAAARRGWVAFDRDRQGAPSSSTPSSRREAAPEHALPVNQTVVEPRFARAAEPHSVDVDSDDSTFEPPRELDVRPATPAPAASTSTDRAGDAVYAYAPEPAVDLTPMRSPTEELVLPNGSSLTEPEPTRKSRTGVIIGVAAVVAAVVAALFLL